MAYRVPYVSIGSRLCRIAYVEDVGNVLYYDTQASNRILNVDWQGGIIACSVSLPFLLFMYHVSLLNVDVLLDLHSVACSSSASMNDKLQLLHNHTCSSWSGCSNVVPFQCISIQSMTESQPEQSSSLHNPFIFPEIANEALQFTIITEWQEHMGPPAQQQKPCAVCTMQFKGTDLLTVESCSLLEIYLFFKTCCCMTMSFLVCIHVTYIDAYENVILYSPALHDWWQPGLMGICQSCYSNLTVPYWVPLDAVANFQYYAHERLPVDISDALKKASLFDFMLVARARASCITYLLSDKLNKWFKNITRVYER